MQEHIATAIIKNARQVVTLFDPTHIGPRGAGMMSQLGVIDRGFVAIVNERIACTGKMQKLGTFVKVNKRTKVYDASGRLVTPGLIDCHSHPVFAGNRANEFEMRLAGKSYLEIAHAGGGIKATVKAVRKASANALFNNGFKVLDEMLRCGTTTVEGKSGYGLTLKDEVKMLRVLNKLNRKHIVDVVPTFLGAHEIPEEYKDNPGKYVGLVCDEMIPAVAKAKLAEFCDVFCERGVFNSRQTRAIFQTAQAFGLRLKIHADQFHSTGGAELAAEFRAVSADHLDMVSEEGLHLMSKADVIPVVIPGCVYWLKMPRMAPVRKMIDSGMPVAIGTDLNPGSSPIHSMTMAMTLACNEFKMTPAEALTAATVNAAYAIERGDKIGSLAPGKIADLVIWDAEDYREIPYWFGKNLVHSVFKNGREILSN